MIRIWEAVWLEACYRIFCDWLPGLKKREWREMMDRRFCG